MYMYVETGSICFRVLNNRDFTIRATHHHITTSHREPRNQPASNLLDTMANLTPDLPTVAASVTFYDQSDGLYGELVGASTVLTATSSQTQSSLEGADLTHAITRLCSVTYGYADNRTGHDRTGIQFVNYCSSFVRVRWVDAEGNPRPSHNWTLAPGQQDFFQSTTPGHVFEVSAVVQRGEEDLFGSNEDEAVLGAYRPKRSLPSGSNHCVQIHDGDADNTCQDPTFILEVVLSDPTMFDALVVASSWIDREIVLGQPRQESVKVLDLLHKIVSNVVKHPEEVKYRKLRLSNGTVRKHIGEHWCVLDFLRVLGFEKTILPKAGPSSEEGMGTKGGENENDLQEEYLMAAHPPTESKLGLYRKSVGLLDMLQHRCSSGFVADVAPPTPWDEPIVLSGGGGGGGRRGGGGGRDFMSDEDRWARVERARNFRRRAGPRPRPANAPSDRGR